MFQHRATLLGAIALVAKKGQHSGVIRIVFPLPITLFLYTVLKWELRVSFHNIRLLIYPLALDPFSHVLYIDFIYLLTYR